LILAQQESTYLYAIGEIFLVVIGILIALQINNWNECRKVGTFEYNLKSELLVGVQDELSRMNIRLRGNENAKRSGEVALECCEFL